MNSELLLNKPKTPTIEAKVYKFSSLAKVSTEAKKSSLKLRKIFETGTYQKKTRLTVLDRYKRRLDSINKQKEKRQYSRKSKEPSKINIKKFAGTFFSGSGDIATQLAALAALNSFERGSKGDLLGAIGPGLLATGIFAGSSLLGLGVGKGASSLFKGGSKTTGVENSLRRGPKVTKSGDFRNPFRKKPKITGDVGGFSRVGKAFGRFGKSIVPIAGAALGAVDATMRAQEGDTTGAAIAGTSASLDALAAASAATGIGLPVAGLLSIASFGLDVVNLVRDLSGASEKEAQKNKPKIEERLKQQTKKQKDYLKKDVENKNELTFKKTLNRYEKVVKKFEEFSQIFKPVSGGTSKEEDQRRASNVENLIGDQDHIEEPGYEFTQYTAQYLTGDPKSPAYDESHGTSANYHDHVAFKDRELAIRAYKYLESKGIDVTEFQGFDPVGGHTPGSAHYSGLAFDVPGYQWGMSGPIDERHYNGSRRVRKYLNEFFEKEKQKNKNIPTKKQEQQKRSDKINPQQIKGEVNPTPKQSEPPQIEQPQSFNYDSVQKSRNIALYPSYNDPEEKIVFVPIISTLPQPSTQMPSGSTIILNNTKTENSLVKKIMLSQLG
jgi:hypothetical protein